MIGCIHLHLGENIGYSHDTALKKKSPKMKETDLVTHGIYGFHLPLED